MNRTLPSARWRCSAAAVLAASVLALAACNGGSTPSGTETTTASPTASATPSATPTPTPVYKPADATGKAQNVPVPVLPEAAKAETKEGLEAFAAYWFKLLSYGYETGDASRLEALTSPACSSCERAKAVLSGWHEGGRWLVGGKMETPSSSTTFRVARDGNYQVAIQGSQSALSYYNADGTLHRADPRPDDTGNLMLAVFKDGSWYVNNIQPIVG
jgi:Family of unknown function (DUF6318)